MKLMLNCVLLRVVLVTGLLFVASESFGQYYSVRMSGSPSPSKSKSTSLEGASLQTVSEQEQFKLRRAKEFAEEGDSRSAIALWQSVLDAAGSQLITRDDWKYSTSRHAYQKYVTVAHEIESILAELSTEGLDAYRFRADGEARAILANPNGRTREEVLGEVVRRFFISSVGDEAAFELACLKLDRFEFNGASRLLRKCLEEHPDCTVPENEILLRLALANGRIGDTEKAELALERLSKSDDERIAIVRADVISGEKRDAISAVESWPTKYGSPDRTATMGGVSQSSFSPELSELWSQEFDVYAPSAVVDPNMIATYGSATESYVMMGYFGARPANANVTKRPKHKVDRRLLVDQWQQSGWTPVGGLLFHEGLVYFKRGNRAMCCSAQTGELAWMGLENEFSLDPVTQQKKTLGFGQVVSSEKPKKTAEVQLFGDQLHQAMSIGDGNFYSIEGRTILDGPAKQVQQAQPMPFGYGITLPPRARRNWLSAYGAINGKLRWRREARDEKLNDSKFDVGFSSAPVSGGGLTFVTVNDTGAIWLLALNPKDGSTVWKTFLCDEPSGACAAWATTGIAYSEGDVYVGTGAGIVTAVDAVSGALRWAVRYERTGKAKSVPNPYGMQLQLGDVSGWREDVVVATGRALIVMGSDSAEVFALDQRTGKVIWDSPRALSKDATAEYFLGMRGHRFYVAGKNLVRCYDSIGGRVIWESPIKDSLGTGIVTEDAIYMPEESSIVKLSLKDGKEIGRSSLLTMTREPVGNLYSSGDRLFAVGMARTYALTDLSERLDRLDQRAAKKEPNAIVERAKFRAFQRDLPAAWKDVQSAYALLSEPSSESAAGDSKLQSFDVILGLLEELNLPISDPENTMRLISKMSEDLSALEVEKNASSMIATQMEDTLYRALIGAGTSRKKGSADVLLSIAPLCTKDYLSKKASEVMQGTCSSEDLESLSEALGSADLPTRRIAAAGLATLGEKGRKTLKGSLNNGDPESLRFQIALALVRTGDTKALVELGGLLDSEDASIRSEVLAALRAITEHNFKESQKEESSEVNRLWREWIVENHKTAKLRLPYVPAVAERGRTLASYSSGAVEEFDLTGKKTWSINTGGPVAACGLSNGHRLLAYMTKKSVYEYDTNGRQVWTLKVDGYPTRVYRLENEHTLVATHNPGGVFEYRNDGSIAWQYSTANDVLDARRMKNGNTLITLKDGKIIRVDATGKLLWSKSGLSRPVSAQPLANGNMLVALSGASRVVEVTPDFETVWTKSGLSGLADAMRLPDGNTIISDSKGVRIYTPEGKSIIAHVPQRKANNSRTIRSSGGFYSSTRRGTPEVASRVYRY